MVLHGLKTEMEKQNISDADLASMVSMSTRTVEKARLGKVVSLNTGKRFAKALSVKLEIVKGKEATA
jgi:ribosome-binding protein aMBF1 (putative translation factor)